MAQYGGMYGQGGFSPQEQALTYGQKRYMRGRPSLSQQAELASGYAVPLYAAQEQRKEQQTYMDTQRAWQDKQKGMFDEQIKVYKDQFAAGQMSEQDMFDKTSALQKQFQEESQGFERQFQQQQLAQQKLQGNIGMGLQALGTGMKAYQLGQGLGWWGGGAGGAETTFGGGNALASSYGAAGAGAGAMGAGQFGATMGAGYGAGGSIGSYGAAGGTFGYGAGATGAGAGAGMATASVAGPLALAVNLNQVHRPFEWGMKKLGLGSSETSPEWMKWSRTPEGIWAGQNKTGPNAPVMAYNIGGYSNPSQATRNPYS